MIATLNATSSIATHGPRSSATNRASLPLWLVQGMLALLFLFAGGFKLAAPAELMAAPVPLPILFLRFIGACETLGALGLVLPALTRIRPGLTPLAAALLVPIMIGATVVTLVGGGGAGALFPLTVGALAASVAYGRSRLAPVSGRTSARTAPRPVVRRPASVQPVMLQPAA